MRGDAELLPFRDGSFAGAYATWGVAIVDNLDGDDFSAMNEEHYTSDPQFWGRNGFELEQIETTFEFETHEEADRLLGFYFGDRGRETGKLRFAFRVGLYINRSRGSGR